MLVEGLLARCGRCHPWSLTPLVAPKGVIVISISRPVTPVPIHVSRTELGTNIVSRYPTEIQNPSRRDVNYREEHITMHRSFNLPDPEVA
jgi:hypothetical protein